MKSLTLVDWTGLVETELFAQTYKSDRALTAAVKEPASVSRSMMRAMDAAIP